MQDIDRVQKSHCEAIYNGFLKCNYEVLNNYVDSLFTKGIFNKNELILKETELLLNTVLILLL